MAERLGPSLGRDNLLTEPLAYESSALLEDQGQTREDGRVARVRVEAEWSRGEDQGNRFQDVFFAVLFFVQLTGVIVLVFMYGFPAIQGNKVDEKENTSMDVKYYGVLYLTLICGGFGVVASGLVLGVMMRFPETIIQVAIFCSVGMSFVFVLFGIWSQQIYIVLVGLFLFLSELCYAYAIWFFIPFASVNLKVGLSAVCSNLGIALLAYAFVALSLLWTSLWSISFVGILQLDGCSNGGSCLENANTGYILGMFLSLFWTLQVIQNVSNTTVAGVIGTWWFAPDEASSFCSCAVRDSFIRATTYSFGSICLGSLLVAIIQTMQQLVKQVRYANEQEHRGVTCDTILLCLADCLLSCIDSLLEYFNKFAFIYCGLYGYSYFESGKKVMTLFRARGFEVIISDDLVNNSLLLTSLIVGLLSGCVGLILERIKSSWFELFGESSMIITFLLGFIIGLLLASITFSVVASSVNSVIVLCCEAPAEFAQNHPELSRELWREWRRSGRAPNGPRVIVV